MTESIKQISKANDMDLPIAALTIISLSLLVIFASILIQKKAGRATTKEPSASIFLEAERKPAVISKTAEIILPLDLTKDLKN